MRGYEKSVEIYSYDDMNNNDLGNSMIIRDIVGNEISYMKEILKNIRLY